MFVSRSHADTKASIASCRARSRVNSGLVSFYKIKIRKQILEKKLEKILEKKLEKILEKKVRKNFRKKS